MTGVKTARWSRLLGIGLAMIAVFGLSIGLLTWQSGSARDRNQRLDSSNWTIKTSLEQARETRDRAQRLPLSSRADAIAALAVWNEGQAILKLCAIQANQISEVDPNAKAELERMQGEFELAAQKAQERIVQCEREDRLQDSLKKALAASLELRLFDFPEMHDNAIAAYASAFREYGLDLQRLDVPSVVKRWKLEPRSFHDIAVGCLLDWLMIDLREQSRLNEILELVDDDPWQNEVRAAFVRRDAKGLDLLNVHAMKSTRRAQLLGHALRQCGAVEASVRFLERAALIWPDDFWIQMHLGVSNAHLSSAKHAKCDAVACFKAAIAISPQSAVAYGNLGRACQMCDRFPEAEAYTARAIELNPQIEQYYCTMASIKTARGDWSEVLRFTEMALMLRPASAQAVPLRAAADDHVNK